jgi:tetratricopeptide (TPR) repeat protein
VRGALLAALVLLPAGAHAHAGLREALARLDRQLEAGPSATLLLDRAERQLQDGEAAGALADLDRARAAPSTAAEQRRERALRGLVLAAAGRGTEALAALEQGFHDSPTGPLHRARAGVLGRLGRWAEAAEAARQAYALTPSPEACLEWAEAAERAGRPADAEAVLESGLRQLGGASAVRLALVSLERRLGQPARALRWVQEAEAAHPRSPEWPLLAAELEFERGRKAEAQAALARASEGLVQRARRGRGGGLDAPLQERARVLQAKLGTNGRRSP